MSARTLLLVNGSLWSPGHVIAGAPPHSLCVRDGRIADVGPEGRVRAATHRDAAVVDLEGRVVLPGFIDCHVHLTQAGLDALGVDLRAATSLEEVLETMSSHLPPGRVIRAWGFDPDAVAERRWPTLAELDSIGHPVFLSHVEVHACMPCTGARSLMGLDVAGEVLVGEANSLARRRLGSTDDDDARMAGLRRVSRDALAMGVTTVHAMEGGELFGDGDLNHMLTASCDLPLEVLIYPQLWDVERVRHMGLPRIGGCVLLDGSPGVGTAAMFSDYRGRPGWRGILYRSPDRVRALAREAAAAGMQLALHASGEAAIEQALDAIETAGTGPYPPRIEHFEVPAPGQADRAARLGVVLSVQPGFDALWSEEYVDVLGPSAGRRANPVASLIRAGAVVAGGSDAGITPIDPLFGIRSAVGHSRPSERPSLEDAFRMYTSWAQVAGATPDRGRLLAGSRADLVVLSGDPRLAPDLGTISVEATIVGGRVASGTLPGHGD